MWAVRLSVRQFKKCQSARCLRTNRIASSRGNVCIDTPSVLELFVQLTFPGPPATQYLPEILFFGFSTFTPHSICLLGVYSELGDATATSDVTRLFWPRRDDRQFLSQSVNFEQLKIYFPRCVGPKKVHSVCK